MQVQTFGSKTILLGNKFKQILHVVMNNSKEDILNASITKSYFWKYFKFYQLQKKYAFWTTLV